MLKFLIRFSGLVVMTLTIVSCGLDCIDKKTGLPKSNRTIKEARSMQLFQFEFKPVNSLLRLDSNKVFTIREAWVENRWRYECKNNRAVVVKDSGYQLVIDGSYQGEVGGITYWLGNMGLGGILCCPYAGGDTVRLNLYKDSGNSPNNARMVETITFVKRSFSP